MVKLKGPLPAENIINILKGRSYDCRLYLMDLSEKTIGRPGQAEAVEIESHDALEEEMCEQERYKDLEARIKQDEREEREKKRKRAEIAFNYDDDKNKSDDDLEASDEEDTDEPYLSPEGIKLPTGLELPATKRHGHLIERTAKFVVLNGPQMEVIIKAKHARDTTQNFNFLNFDNPLFTFYKFMCKLIREKKYLPAPPKRAPKPGEAFVHQKPENYTKEEEESDSDSDGDYLHPLLSGAAPIKKDTDPIKLPPLPSNMRNLSQTNPYSSLYAIHTVKPTETQKSPETEPTPSTSTAGLVSYDESTEDIGPTYETDPTEIHNYNTWHQNFYQRPTPFSPGPPLVPVRPEQEVVEQINLAARYVAANGAYAERRLLDQNHTKLSFLYPDNPNIIFYHTKIRYFQCKLNPYSAGFARSKYFDVMEEASTGYGDNNKQVGTTYAQNLGYGYGDKVVATTSGLTNTTANSGYYGGSGSGVTVENGVITLPSAPEPPKPQQFPGFEAVPDEVDEKVKQMRKERARQFMADLLKRKRTQGEKKQPADEPDNVTDVFGADEGELSEDEEKLEYKEEKNRPSDNNIILPDKALPNLISNIIHKQVNKLVDSRNPDENRIDRLKTLRLEEDRADKILSREGSVSRKGESNENSLEDSKKRSRRRRSRSSSTTRTRRRSRSLSKSRRGRDNSRSPKRRRRTSRSNSYRRRRSRSRSNSRRSPSPQRYRSRRRRSRSTS